MKEEYLDQLREYVDEKGIDFTSEVRGRRIIHILCYVGFLEGVQFMVDQGEDIHIPAYVRIMIFNPSFTHCRMDGLPFILLL